MGCHIYVYDKKGVDISIHSIRVSVDHEREIYKVPVEAHKLITKLRQELGCPELTDEQRLRVLKQYWRGEKIDPRERAAIDLEEVAELVNGPDFGRLECG